MSSVKNPLVSIITPCYNMAHCVWRLFDSIITQDYRPIEFILVDDGSTDDIGALVEKYSPRFEEAGIIFIYHKQENQGLGGAINAGLKLISGDYFCWPDADDYLEPQSISSRAKVLENSPDCAVVTGQAYGRDFDKLDTYKTVLCEKDKNPDKKVQFERMLNGDALFCSGCHMVRSSYFDTVYPDRKIYPTRRGQNWQLLLPLYYKYPRAFLDKPVYNYLDFPNSMSKNKQTPEFILFRYDEHEKILRATLEKIEKVQKVDLHEYYAFLDDKYAKMKMEVAIKYNDRKLFENTMAKKQQYVGLDLYDSLAGFRCKHPYFAHIINIAHRVLFGFYPSQTAENLIKKFNRTKPKNICLDEQVSVLIACYNGERFLKTCLECLLSQSYHNIQVVVVNDGSTDQTDCILTEYESAFNRLEIPYRHIYQPNQGAAAAINSALSLATGKYLMVYDVDDILYKDAVYDKVHFLKTHPDYAMVRNNGYYLTDLNDIGKNLFVRKIRKEKSADIFAALTYGTSNNWSGSYMIRADVLFQKLHKKEIYISRYGQNLQFMLPAAYGEKVGFIEKPLMNYYVRPDSDSHYSGRERILEKIYGYSQNRIAIIEQMDIPQEEKDKYISIVMKHRLNGYLKMAVIWQDKKLFCEKIKEFPTGKIKWNLLWILKAIKIYDIFKFSEKCLSYITRRIENAVENAHIRKQNTKSY